MSADLVAFLRARLDEDAQTARRACEYAEAKWHLDEDGETMLWWPPEPRIAEKEREHGLPVVSDRWRGQTIGSDGERLAPHIVRHDPKRVLAEVDAKRAIVDAHEPERFDTKGPDGEDRAAVGCPSCLVEDVPCRTLRLLAVPYALHREYRPEWAPTA